jgi:type IV pilus assembly protein PilB
MKPPPKLKAALISRFKIMAQLNIAERRVPQDGRIKLKIANKVIDYRVSTLPTLFGEKVVLRILDKGNLTLDLEKFGIEPRAEIELMEAIMNPYGMVLVTGPTGSGKTTTLYSALSKINTIDQNIMTAEDPVEYNLFGINQVQVRTDIGMTFAAALKAFLRQDPNIIMVAKSATWRRAASPSRPRSRATSCSRRCTRTRRRKRSRDSSTWDWSRSTSPARSTWSSHSDSSGACARVAGRNTTRRRKN